MNDLVARLRATKCLPRTPGVLANLAQQLQVEEAVLAAFLDVEATGRGYDDHGVVKILFEKHRFWRNLGKGPQQAQAALQHLARPGWVPPPSGYADQGSSKARWDLLDKAAAINETSALMSASWGLGQVLGENAETLGYKSVQDFAKDMALSEDAQLDAMARYLRKQRLLDAMRDRDWRALAAGYNGAANVPAYAKRLRIAYVKHRDAV